MTIVNYKLLTGTLIILVIVSAFSVVIIKHENRVAWIELHALLAERDELQIEWDRLQLGYGTFGTEGRVEAYARDKLGMIVPKREQVEVIVYE